MATVLAIRVESTDVSARLPLLIVLCGFTFFAGLGRPAIADSDEAFYAEAAREMVASGDWLTPHYNYEYRFQKPILYYWLVALTYRTLGLTEFAARLPTALSGLGLALVTLFLGTRWYGGRVGLLGGIIVATSFGYFTQARQSLPDLPLAFFITVAIWAGFEIVESRTRVWPIVAGAAAAGAFLTKGPVGLALALIVLVPGWLLGSGRRWPRASDAALAAGVFLALALPWYVAMARVHGVEYLHRFFVGENLERFATARYNEPRPVWFYLPILAGGMLPWTPFLLLGVPALAAAVKRRALGTIEWRLALWTLLPLLFFTLSIGKQPRYILPILPPLALMLARALVTRIDRATGRRDALFTVAALLTAAVFAVFGVMLWRARPLLQWTAPDLSAAVALIVTAAGAIVAALAIAGRVKGLPAAVACAAAVTLTTLQYAVFSTSGPEPVQLVAARLKKDARPGDRSGTHQALVRNLVFYSRIRQTDLFGLEEVPPFLTAPGRAFCVLTAEDLTALSVDPPPRPLVVVRYLNTSRLKLRALFDPDPSRDLETIVLVVNR
jgi:4-amino-4-deoxy-L-arabinose transferase-like glycosyltransferase